MYDKELIVDILKNIAWSIEQITKRLQTIESSDDFIVEKIPTETLKTIREALER